MVILVRILESRLISGMDVNSIAKCMNITPIKFKLFENGVIDLDIEFIQKFSQCINISSNYILGIIDTPLPIMSSQFLSKKNKIS
jgi:hypothetical protein